MPELRKDRPETPRLSQFDLKWTASPDSSSAPLLGSLTLDDTYSSLPQR